MTTSARAHFLAGRLSEALAAAGADVKANPADVGHRGFLVELLCLSGQWERADLHLDTMARQAPQLAVTLALLRQLVRAEQARRQVFAEGRLPEFLAPPGEALRLQLEAAMLLRAGDAAGALARCAETEERRARPRGTCDGRPFDDFRDLDDLTAPVFEVLTSTGKCFWVPIEAVESIEFRPPQRPRDLLWRQARMAVAAGPDGDVFIPAIYAGTEPADEAAALGRETRWSAAAGAPVRGSGQRCFLIGGEDVPVMEIGTITFARGAD